MSRRGVAFAAGALALASVGALIWSASVVDPGLQSVRLGEPKLDRDLDSAAKQTFGRRVLLIDRGGEDGWSARLLETARSGGWKLFDGVPPTADGMRAAVLRLERDAAVQFGRERGFRPELRDRLIAFGVAEVAVHVHGGSATPVAVAAGSLQDADTLEIRMYSEDVHSFPVSGAEPVFALESGASDLSSLRAARHLDYVDGLWGGELTVEADDAGEYVFPWPAEGARVTVDGVASDGRALGPELPLLVLALPAGRSRVAVTYVSGGLRSKLALAGAAGFVLSALALLIAFRPHPERE